MSQIMKHAQMVSLSMSDTELSGELSLSRQTSRVIVNVPCWPMIVDCEDVFTNPIRRSLRKDVVAFLKTVLLGDVDNYEVRVTPRKREVISIAVSTEVVAARVLGRLYSITGQDGFIAPSVAIGVCVDARVDSPFQE